MAEKKRQPVHSVIELEALLRRVAAEIVSENDALSNSNAASEAYLKKGESIVESIRHVERVSEGSKGDSPATRKRARSLVYKFVQHATGLSRDSVVLYARCYEKFSLIPEAWHLRLSDMQLLLPDDADADLIRYIAERRRDAPDLRRVEVRELIRTYRARSESALATAP
jgi:hypothetical protein